MPFKFLSTGDFPSLPLSSVQSLSCVQLFATPWTAACQASLSITNSRSLLKLMSVESVMPSNHFILCHLFLLPPSIFPSIRVFSNESALRIRWPKYWSFSFNVSPSNEHVGVHRSIHVSTMEHRSIRVSTDNPLSLLFLAEYYSILYIGEKE